MVQPTSPTKGGKPRNTLDQHVEAIHLLRKPKNTSFYFGVFQKWGKQPKMDGLYIHEWKTLLKWMVYALIIIQMFFIYPSLYYIVIDTLVILY